MLNLDTHILLHALTGSLRPAEETVLRSASWSISAIVLWEISKLFQLGRISMGLDDPDFAQVIERLHVWPIDLDVCRALAQLDFTSDPADEIIAATSLVHGVPLVTRDGVLRASRRVPLAL
ncbi:MAG: PIN domain-containing protein [Acidobacteria bacterium]|nr:PIN domain-containing protein [Acidobacteriota bacterium]